ASANAYLRGVGGDVLIGRLFTQGTASLEATNGNIISYLAGVSLAATNVVLNASGNVGTSTTPFQIQVGSTGTLSGVIAGSAWIYSPTLSNQPNPVQLIVGDFSAAGGVSLRADATITLKGALASANGAIAITAIDPSSDISMLTNASVVA